MKSNVIARMVSTVVLAIILLMVALSGFVQIDQGERGIHLRNGEVKGVMEPGFQFKAPFLDTIKRIDVRDQNVTLDTEAYSFDQQATEKLLVSITWSVTDSDVGRVYTSYGTLDNLKDRVIVTRSRDAIKNTFGKFTAEQAVQNRERLAVDTLEAVRKAMTGIPVNILSVQYENFKFSTTYEQSIEARMLAQVEIETTRQRKETAAIQAEIEVVQAEATARAHREQYQAQADGIRLRGEAEADAIKAKAQALAQNTNLVNLNAVDKWDGKLPSSMVPGSSVPFVSIK